MGALPPRSVESNDQSATIGRKLEALLRERWPRNVSTQSLETIERFNGYAARGEDPDFGKGSDAYSRYYGDAEVQPNPCLRLVEASPFYAVPVMPGDLGTKGGLRIDRDARVLDESGMGCSRPATARLRSSARPIPAPARR